MNFGDRIKSLRIEKDWTQEYVCKKLNISSGALSRYETGMYEPKSLELVKDFADLFGVSTDYLLGKSDIRNPEEIEIDTDKIKIGLSKAEYGLPTKEQQEKIEEFAKFVLKDNLKKKEDK
jgi:transcriptional regulator with XRE-family HTH domain